MNNLSILKFDRTSLGQIFDKKLFKFNNHYPQFILAYDKKSLFFISKFKLPVNLIKESKEKTFTESLWEYDVAEFFLKDKFSNSYFEFNLAPNTAWWSSLFKDYRESQELKVKIKHFNSIKTENTLKIGVEIILDSIPINLRNFDNLQGNVNFIINNEFYNWNNPDQDKPDFHKFENFKDFIIIDGSKYS